MDFHVATATWLVQVARSDEFTEFDTVIFPLPTDVPKTLCYVPEYVINNITVYLLSLDHLNEGILEVCFNCFYHIMSCLGVK